MKFLNKLIAFVFLSLLFACSPQNNAGGTASEGESFVYGNVFDSTTSLVALAKTQLGQTSSQTQVVLTRLSYTDSGLISTWIDSVIVTANGDFEVPVSDSGVYTLLAHNPTGLSTIYAEVDFTGNSVNLGKLGMYQPIELQATIRNIPSCNLPVKISIPGYNGYATLNEESSFSLNGIRPGRSTILAQCGDTVQQWNIVLPGNCTKINLDSIPWTPRNLGATLGGRGIGQNPSIGYKWNWRHGGMLVVDSNCTLVKNGEPGHGLKK